MLCAILTRVIASHVHAIYASSSRLSSLVDSSLLAYGSENMETGNLSGLIRISSIIRGHLRVLARASGSSVNPRLGKQSCRDLASNLSIFAAICHRLGYQRYTRGAPPPFRILGEYEVARAYLTCTGSNCWSRRWQRLLHHTKKGSAFWGSQKTQRSYRTCRSFQKEGGKINSALDIDNILQVQACQIGISISEETLYCIPAADQNLGELEVRPFFILNLSFGGICNPHSWLWGQPDSLQIAIWHEIDRKIHCPAQFSP